MTGTFNNLNKKGVCPFVHLASYLSIYLSIPLSLLPDLSRAASLSTHTPVHVKLPSLYTGIGIAKANIDRIFEPIGGEK